ncbi:glycosyltransferase 87 family protein [Geodermatophilus sp. DSM 44513]|uniref:glycosyltransferase family 87 protein n=1 Tax=Geodermatophilus sp. DSM 44513 TaxID=1528104 RepID=UPI0028F6D01E|nr:glycosyltransferase 87 family protein [Geodermatophilus sp. DSM 44513]WNV75652.1 glycosyltransferase 87 family protein [Geodermatophilus sp. DSM 44513]
MSTDRTVPPAPVGGTVGPASPHRPDRVVPSWTDPVVAQASEAVGGPWGRHAVVGRASFWTPLRVCLLFTTAVLGVAWLKQVPCSDGDWTGSVQYTHLCYSDPVPLFGVYGQGDGALPYLDARVEYPVLTGAVMALAAWLSGGYDALAAAVGLPAVPPVQSYTVVTALLMAVCALVVTRAVLPLTGRRPWDTAMVALSPVLLVYAFNNWDLVAVALTALALWAWARERPVLAGALLGLGVAAKLYPLLVLGALFLLCLRAGALGTWLRAAAAAAGAWLVVNVPVALAAPENWGWFFAFSRQRPANPESIWNVLLTATGERVLDGPLAEGQTPSVLNAVVAVLLVALAAWVAWLVLSAPVRPRVAQVAFLLVAGFLLLNKVYSPQYALWLLPLAVLARPRWRSLLVWQSSEALVWVMTMLYYLGTQNRGVEVEWFFTAVLLRDAVLVALMALVAREVRRPDEDVVRTSWPGVDDPAGGVLDGAPDAVTLRSSGSHRGQVPSPT